MILFGSVGTVSLIEKLYTARKENQEPWFRYAAYRAIDHILIRMEEFGGKKELDELNQFFPKITDKESGEYTRVEWTINRLKDRESSSQ